MFIWLFSNNRLLTNGNRAQRGMFHFPFCYKCGLHIETEIRVIRDCEGFRVAWKSVVPRDKWDEFQYQFDGWITWNILNKGSLVSTYGELPTFFAILVWLLWKGRNGFVFNLASHDSQSTVVIASAWMSSLFFKKTVAHWVCD